LALGEESEVERVREKSWNSKMCKREKLERRRRGNLGGCGCARGGRLAQEGRKEQWDG